MKSILIALNLLLAAAVVWNGLRLFGNVLKENPKTSFTVKKRKPRPAAPPGTSVKKTEAAAEKTSSVLSGAEKVKLIAEQNIFNQERCPNTMFGGNTRVELTLVGTFRAGSTAGAVILQKSSSRNQFPFFGMMNPNGQQGGRRMGIGPASGNPPQGQTGTRRQRGGAQSVQANRNAQGVVQPGAVNTANQTPTSFKQYVRLGETLANGYKLVEVERTRVVLTRGSDKLELELADASKNAPQSGSGRRRNVNQTQIMQQMLRSMQNMQRMQMMQNFEMMRMNRQNQQNQSGGRGGMAPRGR